MPALLVTENQKDALEAAREAVQFDTPTQLLGAVLQGSEEAIRALVKHWPGNEPDVPRLHRVRVTADIVAALRSKVPRGERGNLRFASSVVGLTAYLETRKQGE